VPPLGAPAEEAHPASATSAITTAIENNAFFMDTPCCFLSDLLIAFLLI
jgi:hypothetical protein